MPRCRVDSVEYSYRVTKWSCTDLLLSFFGNSLPDPQTTNTSHENQILLGIVGIGLLHKKSNAFKGFEAWMASSMDIEKRMISKIPRCVCYRVLISENK